MQAEELPAVFAHGSELTDHLAILTVDEPDMVVGQVRDVEIALTLVRRERDTTG